LRSTITEGHGCRRGGAGVGMARGMRSWWGLARIATESWPVGWERGQEPLEESWVERRIKPSNQSRSPDNWRAGAKTDSVFIQFAGLSA